jgi:hypothetical protein
MKVLKATDEATLVDAPRDTSPSTRSCWGATLSLCCIKCLSWSSADVLRACLVFSLAAAAFLAVGGISAIDLPAGRSLWHPELSPEGPIVVVVTLKEQRAYVYRNGIGIGVSTISSGREGYQTPAGVYTILQKERDHYSNRYDNAPMPFMERLTWDGIALHGGHVPGYPASHGCIRLPQGFAEQLFAVTRRGQVVVIVDAGSAPVNVVHPALLAPITPWGEQAKIPLFGDVDFWDEERQPDGPVSVLVGIRDKAVVVLRNGVIIGSSPLAVEDGFSLQGSILFVVEPGFEVESSKLLAAQPSHRSTMYTIAVRGPAPSAADLAANLHVSAEFARRLYGILTPGTTIIVTNWPAVVPPATRASMDTVLESSGDGAGLAQ